MFLLFFFVVWAAAAQQQNVRTAAGAAPYYCPIDGGNCDISSITPDFWVLDPATFVHQGKAVPLESNLGFVKQESDTQFVFVLTNELHFRLTPATPNRYKISLISETLVAAESSDLFAEELIRGYFLHENNTIELISVDSSRTIIKAKDASIHLVAASDFLKFAIQRATPQLMSLDGEWVTAAPDKKTLLRLIIAREGRQTMLLSLEGIYNTYEMRTTITDTDNTVKHIATSPAMATSLEADNSTLLNLEKNVIQTIELANRMTIQQIPVTDSTDTVVLKFWNSANQIGVTFYRPRFASKYNSFHQITPTKWEWMPSTYTGDLSVISQTRQHENVLLEVRQNGEAAAILDLYIGVGTHLRSLIIRSARAGNPPLRTVYTEKRDERDDKFIVELMNKVLEDITSVDLDPSGRYLSLVGEHHSMAFSSVGLPSAGVWVLDHKNSLINGQRAVSRSSVAHQIHLHIKQEGEHLKAVIQGDVSHVEFSLVNTAAHPSQQIIRVKHVARRTVPQQFESTDSRAVADHVITSFIKDGTAVNTHYSDEGFISVEFKSDEGTLVFIHPLEYTAGLLGYWESAETGASLRLKPSGIGQLTGVVKFMDSRYRIRLSELSVEDGSQNLPMKWRVELRKIRKAPEGILYDIWKEISDYEGITKFDKSQNPFEQFNSQVGLYLKSKTVLEVSCDAGLFTFTRVLPPEVRARIEGDWFVEFVALQDGNGTTEVSAVSTESMVRHVVTLQETGNEGAIVRYEGRVLKLPSRNLLQTFSLEVNPYGMLRISNLKEMTTAKPEDDPNRIDTYTSKGFEKTDVRLRELLIKVLASIAEIGEESIYPWKVEAAPGELMMTDGGSVLALSRGLPTEPVTVPLLLLITGDASDVNEEEFTMIQYAQEAEITSKRRRLEEGGSPPSETLLSYRMIEGYRRRLMAADTLDETIEKIAT